MSRRAAALLALGLILAVASLGALAASSAPDGLERVAADLGFAALAAPSHQAPAAGYRLGHGPLGKLGAAVLGTLIVGLLSAALGRLLRRSHGPAAPGDPP